MSSGSSRLEFMLKPKREGMVFPAIVNTGTPIQAAWHETVKPLNGNESRIKST